MNKQEQNEIVGRTVLERNEYRKKLAALEVKARGYADSMRIVAQDLHPVASSYGPLSFISTDDLAKAVAGLPDRKDVETIREEIQNARAKIEYLTTALRDMGVE